MNADSNLEIISVDKMMKILYIGKNAAYDLLNNGEIKAFRIGNTWKIPRAAIDEYIINSINNSQLKNEDKPKKKQKLVKHTISDPVDIRYAFISECLEYSPEEITPANEIRDAFNHFCEINNVPVCHPRSWVNILKECWKKPVYTKNFTVKKHNDTRGYCGVVLKSSYHETKC